MEHVFSDMDIFCGALEVYVVTTSSTCSLPAAVIRNGRPSAELIPLSRPTRAPYSNAKDEINVPITLRNPHDRGTIVLDSKFKTTKKKVRDFGRL